MLRIPSTAMVIASLLLVSASMSVNVSRASAQASLQTQEKAQNQSAAQAADKPVYTPAETAIIAKIKTLRSTPDSERGAKTSAIAGEIAALPGGKNKLRLAFNLSNLSTEGDFGHQSLQDVANTLTLALTQNPLVEAVGNTERPASPYLGLAKLVRYEHVTSNLNDPEFNRAEAVLLADEAEVEKADFTLTDLAGKSWTLSKLRGKVVLVNFWATWCPPCRKEMPDLDALAHRFAKQGLVVLSLSDEDDHAKVASYVASHNINYPILLDTGGGAKERFHVEGIPKTFIFGRDGKLAAQSIDMRTLGQFLAMLQQAGMKP
jgi:peroxiredoxin